MAKFGKKYQDAAKLVEAGKAYDLAEAIEVVKKTATAKFDESVDVAVRLGVNPKYADQQVRGAVVLPHGTGKSKRVLVFAKGDKVAEAEAAGADFVGSDELVAKIKEGWCDFDVTVATPDMMGVVKVKPAAAKGQYMRNITVSTTMGPAVTVNTNFKAAKAE